MEASALQAPASLPEPGVGISGPRLAIAAPGATMPAPLLRLRSDEQLVALFRAGHDEAFRAIHDRYHKRLFAYTRQMLPGRQDAEDALQDVFVRAYAGLRASNQRLALRAWLFRVAHNRCIDELRRPTPPAPEVLQLVRSTVHDPLVEIDLRESLRRLIEDIRRLPEQQRSALLMRELAGMSYADLSASLGVSVGAVKSLLVRARVALAQAAEARDTSCFVVREQLVEAHDRGIRPNANARKHMRDCVGCKSFRRELRGISRQLAAIGPAAGPLGVLAKALGFSGGAGGGAAGGGGIALLGGGGAAGAGGIAVGISHVATLLAAAAATAGGAAAIQHTMSAPAHHARPSASANRTRPAADPLDLRTPATGIQAIAKAVEATVSTAPRLAATADVIWSAAVRARLRADPLGGGPVHAPVIARSTAPTTQSAAPRSTAPSSGSATAQSPSSSSACAVPAATDASTASSTTTSESTGTDTSATAAATPATSPTVAGTAISPDAQVPCIGPPVTSTSTTSAGSASAGSGGGAGSTTSSGTGSSASGPSASGSSPSGGSQSTTPGAGSASK